MKYIVLDNMYDTHAIFDTKTALEEHLCQVAEENDDGDYFHQYVEVYELGTQLDVEIKPRTVVVKTAKVTRKKMR